jgi:prolyl-tRNA synthetase
MVLGVKLWVFVFQHKESQFSDWYRSVLYDADILDQRFPLKGFNVWRGHGTKIMETIMALLETSLNETGHSKMYFPLLIPETVFGQESRHLKGFEEQVFWVNHAGRSPLSTKLVVRPTSETAMYPMFSLWIRSHGDLPLKVYQTVSVFRYETKSTKPLLRDREMYPFNEAHTAHASLEEAKNQIATGVQLYTTLFSKLALPYLLVRKPSWELFPGALSAYEFYTLLPDGKVLETGSVNNLGQAFAKVYDITFEQKDGTREYVYQTCYGQSERLLASLIAIHGDDHGLVLPASIAPIQVVITPITYTKQAEAVLEYSRRIKGMLEKKGFTVTLDESALTPGRKFYFWEQRGVPLRLELGIREQTHNTVTMVKRPTFQRTEIPLPQFIQGLTSTLRDIDRELLSRATATLHTHITRISSLDEIEKAHQQGKTVLRLSFCGQDKCRQSLEDVTNKELIGYAVNQNDVEGTCVSCNQVGKDEVFLAESH